MSAASTSASGAVTPEAARAALQDLTDEALEAEIASLNAQLAEIPMRLRPLQIEAGRRFAVQMAARVDEAARERREEQARAERERAEQALHEAQRVVDGLKASA